MKKIAAISLISLLFFNWYGYRLLSDLLGHRSDSRLEARLDKDEYDPAELIELRVPMNLPYHNDWQEFERFQGEIDVNGVHYKYVKRKVENGELVLLCLPNTDRQKIENARDEFFKLVNDLQQSNQGSKKSDSGNSIAMKNFLSDYRGESNDWSFLDPDKSISDYFIHSENMLLPGYLSGLLQPPRC